MALPASPARLPDSQRGKQALHNLLIETPRGRAPLSELANVEEGNGPNQISSENTRRRIVLSTNSDGSVGFTTLARRNGILKISHYINLCDFDCEVFGKKLIARGSLERLTPV